MELKPYQQKVIEDLERFLDCVNRYPDLRRAFRAFWDEAGYTGMPDYQNNVPRTPHVCVKVPTAGGKTFIAANALRSIFENFRLFNPGAPELVIWLVPSLTILEQTYKNLNDPRHPYRAKLNTHFNARVAVYRKDEVLQGAGFNADAVREQLTIIVLSYDSLRARNKEDRKIFQENGYLASFVRDIDPETLLGEHDETALINVLRGLKPVVVVDESHNAESELSVEMLRNLNPRFILDLTATPKNNSNIMSFVDASALKREHMVKLPVIVYNQKDKTEVLQYALDTQRSLEAMALKEEKETGKYIRPIVLFQAQPRSGEETETFEKIKEKLIALGIPEEQVKIKTAEINELKDIDLMSRECPVRYIITVNALKEGWDCPFAYVLASLANRNSAVDVEQIVGRVLRQPHVTEHREPALNMSYLFTASNQFLTTLNTIVKGLNRAGFSGREVRQAELPTPATQTSGAPQPSQTDLFSFNETDGEMTAGDDQSKTEPEEEIDVTRIALPDDASEVLTSGDSEVATPATPGVKQVFEQALQANAEYEAQMNAEAPEQAVPLELTDKMNRHAMKEVFATEAARIQLPQFFQKVESEGGFWDEGEAHVLLEPNELLTDFELSRCDIDITFGAVDTDVYAVDLEKIGENDYQASFKKLDARRRTQLNEYILSLPPESKLEAIIQRFRQIIGNMYPIADREISEYVRRILARMPPDQLRDCLESDLIYGEKIKQKIKALTTVEREKKFSEWLDTDQILVKPEYRLPSVITPSSNAPAITKSLYQTESSLNGFEQRLINEIANLENVVFWHKNLENKGFCLNGFINHYPDFIVRMRSGKTLLVEAKGDDRDNSDSARKLKLGQLWASKAGNDYRYLMIFDNNRIDGAFRLAEGAERIRQM
jgi:type III restriction enzyme